MLCLAVLLATAAAFGLHPEPADESHDAGVAFSAAESARSGGHLCVACLSHAPALTASLAVATHAPQVLDSVAAPVRQLPPPRLSRTPCSGLSPPAFA